MKKSIALLLVFVTVLTLVLTSCQQEEQKKENTDFDNTILTEIYLANSIISRVKNGTSIKIISDQGYKDGTDTASWECFYSNTMFVEEGIGRCLGQDGYLAYSGGLQNKEAKRVYRINGDDKTIYFGYETYSTGNNITPVYLLEQYLKINKIESLTKSIDQDFVVENEVVVAREDSETEIIVTSNANIKGDTSKVVEYVYKVDAKTKELKTMKVTTDIDSSNPYIREYQYFYNLPNPTRDYMIDISSYEERLVYLINNVDPLNSNYLTSCLVGFHYYPIVEEGYTVCYNKNNKFYSFDDTCDADLTLSGTTYYLVQNQE